MLQRISVMLFAKYDIHLLGGEYIWPSASLFVTNACIPHSVIGCLHFTYCHQLLVGKTGCTQIQTVLRFLAVLLSQQFAYPHLLCFLSSDFSLMSSNSTFACAFLKEKTHAVIC